MNKIEVKRLKADSNGMILLVGDRGKLSFIYEVYVENSGALMVVMSDRIEPLHKQFAAELYHVTGVGIELTGDWEVQTDDHYPVFQFTTKAVWKTDVQRALSEWHDGLEIHDTIDYGVELYWNGWVINDYTGIKTSEPPVELTLEEKLELAEARADRWEAECNQRVTELQEVHARIRKIKSCPRYRLGDSTLGPPMFAHQRGEWIKHDDMRNAAALAFNDEHKDRHATLDADRETRKAAEIAGDDVFDGVTAWDTDTKS